jgi:circadian clock protein KaiB
MSRGGRFKFRLYVAGDTENSAHALSNLTALCREHMPSSYEVEVVDVLQQPKRALADDIFMTPTLLVVSPPPRRKIVGTLSQTKIVLQTLGLSTAAV